MNCRRGSSEKQLAAPLLSCFVPEVAVLRPLSRHPSGQIALRCGVTSVGDCADFFLSACTATRTMQTLVQPDGSRVRLISGRLLCQGSSWCLLVMCHLFGFPYNIFICILQLYLMCPFYYAMIY